MWISDTSIKRPVFATMFILSFVVLGLVSITRLGLDQFPEVSFPYVNIATVYPGASPEEVETLVTKPIEDAVAGIEGVKRVESNSNEGFSRVGIEFNLDVDPQGAAAEVREKVSGIRFRLPREIEDPTISRFDIASLPIATYAVSSPLPADRTRLIVEDEVKPLLQQVEGVAAVEVNGGQVREIEVNLDPRRLDALHLPISVVADALVAANLDLPGGKVTAAGQDVVLRTKGEFTSIEELGDVILRSSAGSTVRLKDVATIVDGYEDRTSTTRLNGVDAVSFSVRKQAGGNTVAVTDRINEVLARNARSFPDLTIRAVHEDAKYIRANVEDVRTNILFGGLMAVLIVFVFMRDWRSTLITSLALPTSVIATFFFMWVAGFSFNMMTLMAISLVIGILIDDAVVVRENIYRHMEHGEDAMTAARRGTSEIGLAVMATTFTILSVFLPVGFMTGIVGQFFKSFALTVAFAVAMSLIIAFTLDPMLSSRFVRYIPPEERMKTRFGRLLERWGRAYDRLDRFYHRVLGWALAHPYRVIAAATVIFLSSVSTVFIIGTEFMPDEDRGEFNVMVDLSPGVSFDETVKQVGEIEKRLLGVPEIRQVFTIVGLTGETRRSQIRVETTPKGERTRTLEEIRNSLRVSFADIPFADIRVSDPEFIQGTPVEQPINVYVRGNDMAELRRISRELEQRISRIPGAVDINNSMVSGQPEMVARVDRARAADMGFSVGSVALQMRNMVEGIVASKLREGDHQFDIRVRLAPEYRNDFGAIAVAPLYSPAGAAVRTGDLVRMEPGVGPSSIDREQRTRQAMIGVDLHGRPLGDVTADVQRAIDEMNIPATFQVGFVGDVELMEETAAGMVLALTLAVAFIYIVLASQFESFTEPLIIMLSLPLAIVGALLMLLVTGNHLGMPAMIGIVMLMGLVTKNAILLVDLTNQMRREHGMNVVEAILEAGPIRLRPILMTTMAMILGMLPAAFGMGEGGEFRAPMALATIGGLITSTMLTLVLVPVAYMLLARATEWVKALRRSPSPAAAAAMRVAGALLLMALLGGVFAVANAFAQESDRPVPPQADPTTALLQAGAGGGLHASPGARALTFDDALRMALERNQELKIAEQRLRESQGRVSEAKANFLPTFDVNYLFTPSQESALLRIPAGVFGPTEQTFRANFVRENVVRLDITQPIYTGGRLQNAFAASASMEESSRQQLERARQNLALRVVEAYYGTLLQRQGISVAEEGVRRAENHLSLARTRYEAGTVARLDVLRAEVELANQRARLIRARSAADIALQGVRTLLSLGDSEPLVLTGSLDEEAAVPSREELLARLPQRADVKALAAQRESAGRLKALALAELKPTVAFTGNLQYQEDTWGNLWSGDNRSYQFAFAVKVPLFAAPRVAAQKVTAEAQEKQAQHGIDATLDAGRLEITAAWRELEAAREIVATQRKAIELAREGLSIAEVSYENGVITSTELNDARLSLLETEWELMQAKYGVIVAAARTKFAAGIS
ncbi:MAG TPA: efflux RND transporter permease subunit [Vicinamibacterales bacterium]|nr:efflux RND transporter permease subunit [Vicinamibacterales bacterium]